MKTKMDKGGVAVDACKVSVIVPVYKVEAYLPQCVESLLAQTLRDIEIILVDDGSPDGCPQICDEYAAKDSRVRVLHKKNAGVLLARQSGLEMATAPYVGFVDSDDFALPEMFETLWREAAQKDAQVVCCSYIHYWSGEKQRWDTRERGMTGFYAGEDLADFYRRFFFDNTPRAEKESISPSLCNKLFQKELLVRCHERLTRECGNIRIGEDMLISYSCLLQAERISVLGDFHAFYYRYRTDSVMNSYKPGFLENTQTLLTALDALQMPPQAEEPVRKAISRYASYTALLIAQNILPKDAPLRESWRATKRTVTYFHTSPIWKDRLQKNSKDLFRFRAERLMYGLVMANLGGSLALLVRLHRVYKNRKKRKA